MARFEKYVYWSVDSSIEMECTHMELVSTPWKVGNNVSATDTPRMDNATKSSQRSLK